MSWQVTLSATFRATYSILFLCFSADKGDTVQEAMCARLIAFCMGERALARFLFENYLHFIYNASFYSAHTMTHGQVRVQHGGQLFHYRWVLRKGGDSSLDILGLYVTSPIN